MESSRSEEPNEDLREPHARLTWIKWEAKSTLRHRLLTVGCSSWVNRCVISRYGQRQENTGLSYGYWLRTAKDGSRQEWINFGLRMDMDVMGTLLGWTHQCDGNERKTSFDPRIQSLFLPTCRRSNTRVTMVPPTGTNRK